MRLAWLLLALALPARGAAHDLVLGRTEIGKLDRESCYALLREHRVRFRRVAPSDAPGVPQPIRVAGPVGGIRVEPSERSSVHAIIDCRLVVALLVWAPALRDAGVRRIVHYSVYRPGARVGNGSTVSGHARGLALDAALFDLRGRAQPLDVDRDWSDKRRGVAPCPVRDDEPDSARRLRSLVCGAVDKELFHVVLTPHYDRAHRNHIHLELKPEVDWTYIR